MHVLVIVNPVAGSGVAKKICKEYTYFLTNAKITFSTYYTKSAEDSSGIRLAFEKSRAKIIAVIGGDGTYNLVINSIPNLMNTTFHFIPGGTGNDFVKMLYPNKLSPKQVFGKILHLSSCNEIDLWYCNEKKFLNGFGVGFDGAVARDILASKSSRWKYWKSIFKLLINYREVYIHLNGREEKVLMLAAANGSTYGGNFKVAPKAKINDGQLDVLVVGPIAPLLRFFKIPKIKKGKHLEMKICTYYTADSLKISCSEPLDAHLDGEYFSSDAITISFAGKINVLV